MFQQLLERTYFGNSLLNYLTAAIVVVVGILTIMIIKTVVVRRLKKVSESRPSHLTDFLVQTLSKSLVPLLYVGAFYMGLSSLTLGTTLSKLVNVLGIVFLTILTIRFLIAALDHAFEKYWLKMIGDPKRESSIRAIRPVLLVIVWGFALVFLLDNLGFKITAVVAGLGIGGIAVALAAQAILGDLFSHFVILFDKPFELGDFVVVGEHMGTVEHVGIKTTRIRSVGGEQLIFSNKDLTDSRLRNFKRMERRRGVFKIGVTYETAQQKLQEIPEIIKETIGKIEDAQFDRAHFSVYGDFSLIFEIVYYVNNPDYLRYMDIQQRINLEIKEEFDKRHIEFAYPTQTLYLSSLQGSSPEPS